jgi:hypothetical protein
LLPWSKSTRSACGAWRPKHHPPINRANAIVFTDDQTLAVAEYNDRVWPYRLPD